MVYVKLLCGCGLFGRLNKVWGLMIMLGSWMHVLIFVFLYVLCAPNWDRLEVV